MPDATTITVPAGQRVPEGPWVYGLIHNDGTTTLSTTRTGLLSEIITGYSELVDTAVQNPDSDPLLEARYDFAVDIATMAQASFLAQAAEHDTYQLADETNEDVYVAYAQDRNDAFAGYRTADGSVSYDWVFEVPLVLIPVHYAPFTDAPAPTGRITWIDPTTETSLLDSLAAAGLIATLTYRESAEPSDD